MAVAAVNGPLGVSLAMARARQTTRREYLTRFVFGGLVTAMVGLVANAFGPVVGGLFLAFPAILPASLTLVAQHSRTNRAAGAGAVGAAFGSLGLMAFGLVMWSRAAEWPAPLVLGIALAAWGMVSGAMWVLFEWMRKRRRHARHRQDPHHTGDESA